MGESSEFQKSMISMTTKEGVTNIPLKEETGLCLHLSRNSISQSMEASTCSHIPGREELFYYEREIEYMECDGRKWPLS